MPMVLQKFIAGSGYCSRRQAEELIKRYVETRRGASITVNGQPAELGMTVNEGDDVRINNKKIVLAKEKIYIILNKPKGYVCTNRKFIGEKNIFGLLIKDNNSNAFVKSDNAPRRFAPPLWRGDFPRLFVVGRLDKDSRGLALLTNDGELTQKLTHPKFEHEKKYTVETHCNASLQTTEIIRKFKKGIDIGDGDGTAKAKDVKYLGPSASSGQAKFEIILTEGKKRQIRRMFRAIGCEVIDLVRTGIGKLELGKLPEGKWKYLNNSEIENLKN
jgi:pseudouridine synthase